MQQTEEKDKDLVIQNLRSINKAMNDKLLHLNKALDIAMSKTLEKDNKMEDEITQINKEIKLKNKELLSLYGQLEITKKDASSLQNQLDNDSSAAVVKKLRSQLAMKEKENQEMAKDIKSMEIIQK